MRALGRKTKSQGSVDGIAAKTTAAQSGSARSGNAKVNSRLLQPEHTRRNPRRMNNESSFPHSSRVLGSRPKLAGVLALIVILLSWRELTAQQTFSGKGNAAQSSKTQPQLQEVENFFIHSLLE